MAFDFLGTYTIDQLNDFEAFLNQKINDLNDEANHLVIEAKRVKNLKAKYETALLNQGAITNDDGLLITKRLEKVEDSTANFVKTVFENKLFEATFIKKGNASPSALKDASSGVLMTKLKKPFLPEIKFQHERLERKIRKCGDLIEQLEEERTIKLIAKNETHALLKSLKEIVAVSDADKTSIDISTLE